MAGGCPRPGVALAPDVFLKAVCVSVKIMQLTWKERSGATAIAAALIVAAAALGVIAHIHFLRRLISGDLLWGASEAYVFVAVERDGKVVSYLRYPWFYFTQYVGAVEPLDDVRCDMSVYHVTAAGVEQHDVKLGCSSAGSGPGFITPLNGAIYANYPALGGLCRWAGNRFESATPEEQRSLGGVTQLSTGNIENGADGWSKRSFGSGLVDRQFTADVGGLFQVSVANVRRAGTPDSAVSIDVQRAGKPAERMQGEFEGNKTSTGERREYNRIF